MQFFIDTANVEEIKDLIKTGLIDGVTTNPTLIAKSGQPIKEVLKRICDLVPGPVSAEVTATEAEAILQEAQALAAIANNIVIKVPLTLEGLKACRALRALHIAVNVTLCFSASQAVLAAKAGATYISPFIGRLDDISSEGSELIEDICHVYRQYDDFSTQVLAASLRHPLHFLTAARAGADIVTLPVKLFYQLYKHPLTDRGLEAFLADWRQTGQSIL